jgi:hypothetical protein
MKESPSLSSEVVLQMFRAKETSSVSEIILEKIEDITSQNSWHNSERRQKISPFTGSENKIGVYLVGGRVRFPFE